MDGNSSCFFCVNAVAAYLNSNDASAFLHSSNFAVSIDADNTGGISGISDCQTVRSGGGNDIMSAADQ